MTGGKDLSFGQRLRLERESHHWSQEQLSKEMVGDKSLLPSIHRWEHDLAHPRPYYMAKLCEAFGKTEELWGVKEQKSRIWNVPYLRNPYFTGRDQLLQRLHRTLAADNALDSSQILAISGLGGIGKTQTAIEYAYRYAKEYEAVLWVRADSRETLSSDFSDLAVLLNLQEKEEARPLNIVMAAVKRWLQEHSPWLLIFDNADDPAVLDFLPRQPGGAAILLTTRSKNIGPHIKPVEIKKMSQEEGINFLQKRTIPDEDEYGDEDITKRISDTELVAAQQLWKIMDGLPLALDQAGAYIQMAPCTLTEYVNLYRSHRQDLLRERGEHIPEEHPDAVATTWNVSFQQIEQSNAAATELLRFCAFLAPDAIPEELILMGAVHLTSSLQALAASDKLLKDAVKTLHAYSLVQRDSETQMLSIHRLVQAVLIDDMTTEAKQEWKGRIVRVLNDAFPEPPFKDWAKCGHLLPHVLACAAWIDFEPMSTQMEASFIFDKAGTYLREQGQYAEAESLLTRTLSIREQISGADLDIATTLSNLAGLYSYQGKYKQAEGLVIRALSIREQHLEAQHPDIAKNRGHLAVLYVQQEQYEQAEQLFQQTLAIYEQYLGVEHPETAKNRNNLAVLYMQQEKYTQAESLLQQALSINKQYLGEKHPETARTMGNLALLYVQQGQYEQAEPLYQQALAIHSGSDSPDTAYLYQGLADLYRQQGNYEQARQFYQRTLSIRERYLEAGHPDTLESLQRLADLQQDQEPKEGES